MEKLDFRIIRNDKELGIFIDRIEHYTGVRLPMDYVTRSRVVGVFLHNRMVAGYMLVTSPTFRSLLFVPDKVKNQNPFFENDSFEMMEVNGLWISNSLKTPILQVKVWAHLIKSIFLSRKKYVLLMRNAENRTMEKLTSMANPSTIFTGTPQIFEKQKTHSTIEVSFTTRWSILLNSHKYILELLRRQKKAARFSLHRKGKNEIDPAPENYVKA